jgi:hypothetical protein
MLLKGMEQAELTGKRLKEMKFKFNKFYSSTMIRAIQTATIIKNSLQTDLDFKMDDLLREGAPIPPEPPVGGWKPLYHVQIICGRHLAKLLFVLTLFLCLINLF